MNHPISRRTCIAAAALSVPLANASASTVSDTFPMQPSEMVKEMVTVSHGNAKRVRELVEAHPSLAKASWDWGFGDWEAAVDAASHVGHREIAEYLIERGARPTLFTAAMLGHIEVVKATIAAQPGIQRIAGPHGISLLAHAKNGGAPAKEVFDYLQSLGDAGSPPTMPLTDEELTALNGTYTFGSGPQDRIEITADKGQLSFTRAGTTTRGLVHLGENTFHPMGAEAVRIVFSRMAEGITLTIHDPQPVITATHLK
jgi:hypothetical protein